MLEYEVIWGHIDILVVAVRRLSRWKVKTLLAGPSPTSPMRRRLPTPLLPYQRVLITSWLLIIIQRFAQFVNQWAM